MFAHNQIYKILFRKSYKLCIKKPSFLGMFFVELFALYGLSYILIEQMLILDNQKLNNDLIFLLLRIARSIVLAWLGLTFITHLIIMRGEINNKF